MNYQLPDIRKVDVYNKTILLRADLDVAILGNKIVDKNDLRLMSGLTTIKYLLKKRAKLIVCGHLGRPKPRNQELGIMNYEFSLEPVAGWLKDKFKVQSSRFARESRRAKFKVNMRGFEGWKITDNLILLENLRFYKGEEENDVKFSKQLSLLADIYINDSFAVCHRRHASIIGVPSFLPHFAGLHLQKEIKELSKILNNPKHPLVVIVGGAKTETKLPLVSKMNRVADYILVGGLVAQEINSVIKKERAEVLIADSNEEKTDITKKSVEKFLSIINLAKMIVWNGPLGKISNSSVLNSNQDTERGTREIVEGIIKTKAYKITGGGDTIEFLQRMKLMDKFDFVSTGGGAMLSFLSGESLVGLEVLLK